MEYIFSQILQMSFQASIVILCVMLVRVLFQKANIPAKFVCILWLLPMIRMICPISVTSKVSIVPQVNTEKYVLSQTVDSTVQNISQNRTILGNDTIQQGTSEMISSNVLDSSMAETVPSLMQILSIVWIVGIILLLCYSLVSIIRLKMKLQESIIVKDFSGKNKIYESDKIETPFVYGFFSPKIYLPSSIWESNYEYVIAHEEAHISRKDHLMKYIGFMITMIHWFNPLAWLMFICLGKDIEMACDEHVVKQIGAENRTEYAETLLSLSIDERKRVGIPLAFGEGETKGRIVHILKYKKTKRILIIFAALIIGIVAVATLTNPEDKINEAEICEAFLQDIFEINEEEYNEYKELEETDPLNAINIWQERYRSYFDETGYETAVSNRVLGYGIKTYQAEYRIKNIEIEENSTGEEEWYSYKVSVGNDQSDVLYQGYIFFSETEEGIITKITPYTIKTSEEQADTYDVEEEPVLLIPNKEIVLEFQEKATKGMDESDVEYIREMITRQNLWLENDYINKNHFSNYENNDEIWNYLDQKGEIIIGYVYDSEILEQKDSLGLSEEEFKNQYGEPIFDTNNYDAADVVAILSQMQDTIIDESFKADFAKLIELVQEMKDTHDVSYLKQFYYMLHDMDYFLLRYGMESVGPGMLDKSTLAKYYGVLEVYRGTDYYQGKVAE